MTFTSAVLLHVLAGTAVISMQFRNAVIVMLDFMFICTLVLVCYLFIYIHIIE